jgi:ribokinase
VNILSLGDLLLDVIVHYDPQSGEADTGPDALQIRPGGSAANFAVWAARQGRVPGISQGASVRFVSRVGKDWAGEMLVRSLKDDGVTASVTVDDEEPTGRVLVMVDRDGHRRMWSYPGASRTLRPEDLDPSWFDGLDAFHLTGYSLLRDGPREAALRAMELARLGGATLCVLDPNPPHLIADYGSARFREMITRLQFDIIFPNLEEGKLLTDKEGPEEIAVNLLEVSPLVVLTLGDAGCLVAYGTQLSKVDTVLVEKPADVTGAGDAFAAGFMVEYLRTRNPRAAAFAANQLAAQVVTMPGGR